MSLQISYNPETKSITVDESIYSELDQEQTDDLNAQVNQLNSLNNFMNNLNAPVPPPSNNITQQVTTQVDKMRQTGINAHNNKKPSEAVKYLTLAIEMALKRPTWEATQYMIEEISKSLGPRADAYMAQNLWPDAYTDSALLCLLKPMDAKNHYRKGRCLQVVGKYHEARAAYATGLATNPNDSDLKAAMTEVNELIG